MIKLDISVIVFFYALFSAIVILIAWLVFGYKKMKGFSAGDANYIWRCPVCSNAYLDSRHEDMSVCPLCGSYNKKEEVGG